jgi:hypothetical protein
MLDGSLAKQRAYAMAVWMVEMKDTLMAVMLALKKVASLVEMKESLKVVNMVVKLDLNLGVTVVWL